MGTSSTNPTPLSGMTRDSLPWLAMRGAWFRLLPLLWGGLRAGFPSGELVATVIDDSLLPEPSAPGLRLFKTLRRRSMTKPDPRHPDHNRVLGTVLDAP